MNALRVWTQDIPLLLNRALVEFTSVMMFHFIGSVSPTPIANGLCLIVLVYYSAKISGAHLNPAISLTFTLLGHTNPIELIIYSIAQYCGAIVGALWISILVPGLTIRGDINRIPGEPFHDGCFVPISALSNTQVFAWEAVSTCCFIVPIFSVVWYTQHKKGYGNSGPLIVGFSLFANALACGQFTGAALNPARALGSPIVFDCPNKQSLLYYVLGEYVGAAGAIVAIIPWYGISSDAWYISKIPIKVLTNMNNRKSIELRTYGESTFSPALTPNMISVRDSVDVRQSNISHDDNNDNNITTSLPLPRFKTHRLSIDHTGMNYMTMMPTSPFTQSPQTNINLSNIFRSSAHI